MGFVVAATSSWLTVFSTASGCDLRPFLAWFLQDDSGRRPSNVCCSVQQLSAFDAHMRDCIPLVALLRSPILFGDSRTSLCFFVLPSIFLTHLGLPYNFDQIGARAWPIFVTQMSILRGVTGDPSNFVLARCRKVKL